MNYDTDTYTIYNQSILIYLMQFLNELTSNDIPKFIEELKIDHIHINIECIEKIDNYLHNMVGTDDSA